MPSLKVYLLNIVIKAGETRDRQGCKSPRFVERE